MGRQVKPEEYLSGEFGLMTEPMVVGTEDFQDFQFFILSKSRARTKNQKILVELAALKYQMEKYLEKDQKEEVSVGKFLKSVLEAADIRQNRFAEYIGIRPPNFNKIVRGERRLSLEQAIIIGNIFDMEASIWIGIQTKNDLRKIAKAREKNYSKYNLKELLAK